MFCFFSIFTHQYVNIVALKLSQASHVLAESSVNIFGKRIIFFGGVLFQSNKSLLYLALFSLFFFF